MTTQATTRRRVQGFAGRGLFPVPVDAQAAYMAVLARQYRAQREG